MARVTHVKKAQQRYHQKPVIDPATGQQKRTPVVSKRTGEQKVSKRGPQYLRVTENDLSRPKPPETCGKCQTTIEVGMPYKHITPKSGPYGGRRMVRCASCPSWQVWEYSSSLSARTAEIAHNFEQEIDGADDPDSITSALSSAADSIREIAEEKRESASNIEEGFGHSTSMSEELESVADELDSWADEVEQADIPDLPEPEEQDCEQCEGGGEHGWTVVNADGSGHVFEDTEFFDTEDEAEERLSDFMAQWNEGKPEADQMARDQFLIEVQSCIECDGSGQVTPDEPTDEQMDEWRSEVEDAVSIVNECPV